MFLLISYVTLDLPYYIGLYRIFLYVLFIVTCCLSKIKNSWFLIPDSWFLVHDPHYVGSPGPIVHDYTRPDIKMNLLRSNDAYTYMHHWAWSLYIKVCHFTIAKA